jgi:hypothetical protein
MIKYVTLLEDRYMWQLVNIPKGYKMCRSERRDMIRNIRKLTEDKRIEYLEKNIDENEKIFDVTFKENPPKNKSIYDFDLSDIFKRYADLPIDKSMYGTIKI